MAGISVFCERHTAMADPALFAGRVANDQAMQCDVPGYDSPRCNCCVIPNSDTRTDHGTNAQTYISSPGFEAVEDIVSVNTEIKPPTAKPINTA